MGADKRQPSRWAIERFGHALALELWSRVPRAVASAVSRAVEAHKGSQLTTRHAFGGARWVAQYEELAMWLGDLDGALLVRPPAAFYPLTIVGGHLFLPWCYGYAPGLRLRDAQPNQSFGRMLREVVAGFGPQWPWTQLSMLADLAGEDEEERRVRQLGDLLRQLDPPPQALIVGYACSPDLGLLGVSWGEATLDDQDVLHWHHTEELPVPDGA